MDYACKGDNILISTNLSRAWSQRDRPDIYSIILFICHLMLAVCPPLRAHSHAARSAALHCWAPRQSGRPRRVILRTFHNQAYRCPTLNFMTASLGARFASAKAQKGTYERILFVWRGETLAKVK